jgi:hypothetical protein
LLSAALALVSASVSRAQSPFATRVIAYDPAPGQFVNNPLFNDPSRALGAPIGGGIGAPDNSKLVTLGGFGGSITLAFDHRILKHPRTPTNPLELDAIVFGNAYAVGGDLNRRFAEPGVIEVSIDANNNGLADDEWYVIAGSHLGPVPSARVATRTYNPANLPAAWRPAGRTGTWSVSAYQLNDALFTGTSPVLEDPGTDGALAVFGYADCSSVIALGDVDGDGTIDSPLLQPERFYTIPTDPHRAAIALFSGGGDAFSLDWAVRADGTPANLPGFDFIRITTGVDIARSLFGECSTEIGAVAEVRPRKLADVASVGGTLGPDDQLTVDDVVVYLSLFFADSALADCAQLGGAFGSDGRVTTDDLIVFLSAFFTGE